MKFFFFLKFRGTPFDDYEESVMYERFAVNGNKTFSRCDTVYSAILFLHDQNKDIDYEILKTLPKGIINIYQCKEVRIYRYKENVCQLSDVGLNKDFCDTVLLDLVFLGNKLSSASYYFNV